MQTLFFLFKGFVRTHISIYGTTHRPFPLVFLPQPLTHFDSKQQSLRGQGRVPTPGTVGRQQKCASQGNSHWTSKGQSSAHRCQVLTRLASGTCSALGSSPSFPAACSASTQAHIPRRHRGDGAHTGPGQNTADPSPPAS